MRARYLAALFAVPVAVAAAAGIGEASESGPRVAQRYMTQPAPSLPRLPGPGEHLLGRSARGRPILAYELGDPRARTKVLVVGCIHGDEPAGTTVVARLAAGAAIAGVDLWLVPSINPDGQAARTRQNAHGVDLNRNFPWHWQPLGPPGTQQYAGPHVLSEPESGAAYSLIVRLHPAVTVWFHQPLGVVDESGGVLAIERRFAWRAGLPLRRLTRYPGSAASWQDHRFRGSSAFVVELPAGSPRPAQVQRWAAAVRATAVSATSAARAAR